MNAVIYARYSSHNQTEQSIEGQLRDCYEYAKRNDLTIIGEYIDRAISGKTDERPDFQRMIKDASKRQFERILVWKLDRFARNRYDSATYKHKLKQYGVKVISAMENVGEGDESVLLEALLEASAEYYSLDLKKKIARGMRESALRGKFVGGTLPWWCRVDDEQKLTVIDERAAIVREAFMRYDSGEGSKSIVSDFAKRGLRSNRGVPVTLSWLLSILKNRKQLANTPITASRFRADCLPSWTNRYLTAYRIALLAIDAQEAEKPAQKRSIYCKASCSAVCAAAP